MRQRLLILQGKLKRCVTVLQAHQETVARAPRIDALVLGLVEDDRCLLRDVKRCDDVVGEIEDTLTEIFRELMAADLKSERRRQEAERLSDRIGDTFPYSSGWNLADEISETFTYAASPLLRAEGGILFGPTALFVKRYAEHAVFTRIMHKDVILRLTRLRRVVREALEGPLLQEPTLMDLEDIDELHHSQFERLIADLLDRDGYRIIRSGGGPGDMGADVLAADPLGRFVMVQAKHFLAGGGSVGQPVVQHLYGGAMATHPSTLPVVVTNGRLTGGAKGWAAEDCRVRLIGREELRRWAENGESLESVLKGTGPA
ncbi:restriction endonuclease [Streptomyces huiliensis]|uniref:restriction endonuclease n=1 Tax=Streptomyces huiliensis TaxID=2876027 RepID=UPI001CBB3A67|nr:restriction endonuclease [Streptomyces huiliensis]MBZ4322108.1 restriction endonuclease [Streptomyces huiliensis]